MIGVPGITCHAPNLVLVKIIGYSRGQRSSQGRPTASTNFSNDDSPFIRPHSPSADQRSSSTDTFRGVGSVGAL